MIHVPHETCFLLILISEWNKYMRSKVHCFPCRSAPAAILHRPPLSCYTIPVTVFVAILNIRDLFNIRVKISSTCCGLRSIASYAVHCGIPLLLAIRSKSEEQCDDLRIGPWTREVREPIRRKCSFWLCSKDIQYMFTLFSPVSVCVWYYYYYASRGARMMNVTNEKYTDIHCHIITFLILWIFPTA
jgi:hypothetical protein